MGAYTRGTQKCPRTEIDDHEDATDLKPVKPVKREVEEGKETLQSYKASLEFVLERHLKREEALVPGAKHVKMFTIKGKGDDTIEEKVSSDNIILFDSSLADLKVSQFVEHCFEHLESSILQLLIRWL
jgi:hypothetical protein